MSIKRMMVLGTLLVVASVPVLAEEILGLPLHVEKLNHHGVRLWVGDHESTTAVTALATAHGIVVIDTTDIAGLDAEFRKLIVRELGRDDFKYVINTHEHGDHTAGNAVYSDCEIIGHRLVAEGMAERQQGIDRSIAWLREHMPELEASVAEAAGSELEAQLAERLKVRQLRLRAMEQGIQWHEPTITFSDRMTLDMGDATFELYYAGGLHTASDIFVFVPEFGLLFTGDTMADVWLTESAGCLTSFDIRREVKKDFPLLLANWKSLVERRDEIRDLITGHWNGDITYQGFVNRYNYVKSMWEGIAEAAAAGSSLDEVRVAFGLEQRFPEMVDSPGISPQWHQISVMSLWCEITGTDSAAFVLRERIDEEGIDQAVSECRNARARGGSELYFSENEFNGVGYFFLSQGRLDEAVSVFELNAVFYPESWNVYDSLAEACHARGESGRAIELYERSLEINPDNQNGVQMLERIRSEPGS